MSASIDIHELARELADLIGPPAIAPLLDANQAAELLSVPASWLMTEARAGRVPHCKLGKYTRFKRDELLAWVDSRVTGPRR